MDEIWKHLAASGPVALVLGVALRVVWGKLIEQEKAFQAYRDKTDSRIDDLHKSVVDTIRELTGAIRGGEE